MGRNMYALRIAQALNIDLVTAEQVLNNMESRGVIEILDRQFVNEANFAYSLTWNQAA